jgi:hypothetical protein
MNKAFFIIHKPVIQVQVSTIINKYEIKSATIFIQSDSGRIDIKTVSQWNCLKNIETNFEEIDFNKLNKDWITKKINQYNYDIVALPLLIGRVFYKNLKQIKKRSRVINLCDGSCEKGTIFEFYLRIEIKTFKDFIRSYIKSLERRNYLADESYSAFYPLQSCFSKRTFNIQKPIINIEKKVFFESLTKNLNLNEFSLFISGLEYTNEILSKISGVKKYIATSKDKEIFICEKRIEIPFFLCTEDLLTFFKPKRVIGYHSDAIAYAKVLYPDINCYILPSKKISKIWGRFHDVVYRKQLSNYNLIFSKKENLKYIIE